MVFFMSVFFWGGRGGGGGGLIFLRNKMISSEILRVNSERGLLLNLILTQTYFVCFACIKSGFDNYTAGFTSTEIIFGK